MWPTWVASKRPLKISFLFNSLGIYLHKVKGPGSGVACVKISKTFSLYSKSLNLTSFLLESSVCNQLFLAQTHCSMALCNAFPIYDKNAQKFAINKLKNPVFCMLAMANTFLAQYNIWYTPLNFKMYFLFYPIFYRKWNKLLTTLSNKRRDIIENTF